jgi:antitoxin component YwqK of YwqJK toxin-antitoxin module
MKGRRRVFPDGLFLCQYPFAIIFGSLSHSLFLLSLHQITEMAARNIILTLLLAVPLVLQAQNATDESGKKQGPWIKKYPNGNTMYEGTFKNDKPVGIFKRYSEEGILQSELNYSATEDKAYAVFYHPDGKKAGEGLYVSHKKEGLWKFYAAAGEGYLISEEYFLADIRNGVTQRYYPDGSIAEKIVFSNGIKTGQWIQYYPDGKLCLRAEYMEGKLDGPFTFWYPNGKIQFEGKYINDIREGDWMVFNEDGTLKQVMEYREGRLTDPSYAEKETKFLDDLEKNKGKIKIPDISGNILQ